MNCKPGDLALIVCAYNDPQHLGKIITCLKWWPDEWGGCWSTSPALHGAAGQEIGWHDDDLRPIRDPGEDAQDEMLRPLPAPSEPIAA